MSTQEDQITTHYCISCESVLKLSQIRLDENVGFSLEEIFLPQTDNRKYSINWRKCCMEVLMQITALNNKGCISCGRSSLKLIGCHKFSREVVKSSIRAELKWLPTLYHSCVVVAQHDVHHEGELGSALAERLNETQHAEVMGHINCILRPSPPSPPHTKALPDS